MRQQEKESIKQFRDFINRHPNLLEQVRREGESWQPYYEKWVLLGEEDPYWEQFKSTNSLSPFDKDNDATPKELFNQLTELVDKINVKKVQKQVGELNNIITVVDQLLTKYLESRGQSRHQHHDHHRRFWD